jgi:predicted signal transduction protein with EAL and GGDEF domain
MLSVPTLWTVFVINFLALGLIWAYIMRSYPTFEAARFWTGSAFAAAGGDEFCVVLPASTLREGAMIARRILDVCRKDAVACVGADIPISISIGVAQWTKEMGAFSDRLIAAADHALYAAKNEGKNRYAVYAPPPAPPHDALPEQTLRKRA